MRHFSVIVPMLWNFVDLIFINCSRLCCAVVNRCVKMGHFHRLVKLGMYVPSAVKRHMESFFGS